MTHCSDPSCGVCGRGISPDEKDGLWVCSGCFDVPETIDGYLNRLSRALRGPVTTRRRVTEEVRLHLEELAANEDEGTAPADAERRATQRMGSPERLAAEMPHRRWNPWIVIAATILFSVAGFAYSTQQQKLYASTSTVLYIPSAGGSSNSSDGQANNWGATTAPFAQSTEVATQVLQRLHPSIPGLTPTQLSHETSIAAIPTGNGLSFTVTNPSSLNAVRLANAYTIQFPIYLAKNTPDPDLIQMQQGLAAVKLKLAAATSTTPQATLDKWRASRLAFESAITVHNQTTISNPSQITSTVVRTASAPTQTQPQATRMIAIGGLIGLVLGTVLMLVLYLRDTGTPAPPRALAG